MGIAEKIQHWLDQPVPERVADTVEKTQSWLDKPVTRRDLIKLGFGFGFGVGVGETMVKACTTRENPSYQSYQIPTTDQLNQTLIKDGKATTEDLEHYQQASERARELFKAIVNPRLLSKYRYDDREFTPSGGLRDVHDRRGNLLAGEKYSISFQAKLYDRNTQPYKTLGMNMYLLYDNSERLYAVQFYSFPGGPYVIEEVAALGVVRPNNAFPANFTYIPRERQQEVASLIFHLPNEIMWRLEPSRYLAGQQDLKGKTVSPKGEAEISFDGNDGLPGLQVTLG